MLALNILTKDSVINPLRWLAHLCDTNKHDERASWLI